MNVSFSLTDIENVPMLLVQSRLCQMTDRQTDTHTHTHTHTHTQQTYPHIGLLG